MGSAAGYPDPDVLYEHAAFLRALARGLLRDADAAEDVVQETFLAALERPPRAGNLRAWLATVARNFALTRRRADRRRARRELIAARGGSVPPVEDAVARLELQRRVVDAVLRLGEPDRSAIVLRFFYGLKLKEVAKELGIPVAAARSRVRRALARLRAALDADHGGREAWAVLLAPFLAEPRSGGGWWKAALALAAATVVAFLFWSGGDPPEAAGPAEPEVVPPPRAPEPVPARPSPDRTREPEVVADETAPEPRVPDPPPRDAPEPDRAGGAAAPSPVRRGVAQAPPTQAPRPILPDLETITPLRAAATVPAEFVFVAPGRVHPGCTRADYRARATSGRLREALVYEVWDDLEPLALPGFFLGRFEVTNAQWKAYLDANFRVVATTKRGTTLRGLAGRLGTQWLALYAFNADVLAKSWNIAGGLAAVPPEVADAPLRGGLTLVGYRHRVPTHWFGWCRLARLRVGREYADARAPAERAFRPAKELRLRAEDFGRYPVRDVSPNEALAFAEWAGCHLPSEYEWERAARGDRSNTAAHTIDEWDRVADRGLYVWADNPDAASGPVAVDHPGAASPFGARHLLGNVWELTRTFFDVHPRVRPAPPEPRLANNALTAKGGAFGSGWRGLRVSTRTGTVGNADLDLKHENRADSLGLRLVRHPTPGFDALLHSLRRLCYDRAGGRWTDLPHRFALPRMAGVARAPEGTPRALGPAPALAFAPAWAADLPKKGDTVIGVLRADVPLRAGGREVPAGEWFVVGGRDGAPALRTRRHERAPALILESERPQRRRGRAEPARLVVDGTSAVLEFDVEQAQGPPPPGEAASNTWAWAEVHPAGWPGRRASRQVWRFKVRLTLARPL